MGYDTGFVEERNGDTWVLNPRSELPLHITASSQAKAHMFKEALEQGFQLSRNAETAVLNLMTKYPEVGFPEVEAFIALIEKTFDQAGGSRADEGCLPDFESPGHSRRFRLGGAFPEHYDDLRRLGGEMFRYVGQIKSTDPRVQRHLRAELLSLTYTLGAYAARRSRQRAEMTILGWRFLPMPAGCCPDCRSIHEENAAVPRLVVPRHIACACNVFPILH